MLSNVSLLAYNQINVISIQLQLITGSQFLYDFLKLPVPRWLHWFQSVLGLIIFGALVLPGWFLQPLVRDLVFAVPVATLLSVTILLITRESRRGNVAAKTLSFSLAPVVLAEAVQLVKPFCGKWTAFSYRH
ncbi:MAG: hypothetical protein ACUVR8_10230 [Acidobacteriota bacterium]